MPNMLPNTPGLDSAPLLNDAIQFVSNYNSTNPSTPFTRIVADPGDYYFYTEYLTGGPSSPEAYVLVNQLKNVTIDLGDSSLLFDNGLYQGFNVSECQNLVLSNFSIDYQILPFTELRVQQVLPPNKQITCVPLRAFPTESNYLDVSQLQLTQPYTALLFTRTDV